MRLTGISLAILLPVTALAAPRPADSPLTFEQNRGQTAREVQYLARASAGLLFLTDDGMTIETLPTSTPIRFELAGADRGSRWKGLDPTRDVTSYYVGRDRSKWVEAVPHFARVSRRGVYPGIDLVLYGAAGELEYDFVLAPHADPSRIRVRVSGGRGLSIDSTGALAIETASGPLRHRKPLLYQMSARGSREEVRGAFRLLGPNEFGFQASGYDTGRALSIDPVIESSTYAGGALDDRTIATDHLGRTVGTTTSVDFPGVTLARRRGIDIFVRTAERSTQIFGGSGDDQVTSVSIGNSFAPIPTIVVGGYTDSKDLPTELTATIIPGTVWQREFAGGASDGFLLVLGADSRGGISRFLTYIGTPGDDRVTGVATPTFGSIALIAGTTNGRGLPAPPTPIVQPLQSDPAGGLDGFLIAVNSAGSGAIAPSILVTTYLGGSGDDQPLGVMYGRASNEYYVTGETRSADFPVANARTTERAGDSDAFLTRITNADGRLTLAASALFGGKGADRGVQMAKLPDGAVVLGGVTSSSDLPLQNPAQPSYGGGSDAFVAQFSTDLSQLLAATYWGGSGDDEATTVAADFYGNLFVGGWTSSRDFPTRNAVQPDFAGGPGDGFLLHFDTDGSLHQATCFGGSGSDRIQSVYAPGGPIAWIAGETTSADLPLQSADQTSIKGTRDGFVARIAASLLSVSRPIGGKDLRSYVTFSRGAAAGTTDLPPVKITSSDPGKVLLSASRNELGAASVALPLANEGEVTGFYMDCLDEGLADLTFEAPGFDARKVRASCFAPRLSWSVVRQTPSVFGIISPVIQTNPFERGLFIYLGLLASDPDTGAQTTSVAGVRPGVDPIALQIANSNPAAGSIAQSPVLLGSSEASVSVAFQPLALGETDVSFSSPRIFPRPSDRIRFVVGSPLTMGAQQPIPGGFQSRLILGFTGASVSGDAIPLITVTSLDPSKLVLSADTRVAGSGTLTVPFNALFNVSAQALASDGEVGVVAEFPGFDPVSTTVRLAPATVNLTSTVDLSKPLSLGIGETVTAALRIGAGNSFTGFYTLNPGSDQTAFSLENSNPAAVSISPPAIDLRQQGNQAFQIRGTAEGETALRLRLPAGISSGPAGGPLPVTVKRKALQMSAVEVGKDLAARVTVVFPFGSPSGSLTLTVANPALALLSQDSRSLGQPSIPIAITSAASSVVFVVHGLAASGQTTITASFPGLDSATATVTLLPSGFGWNSESVSGVLYSNLQSSPALGIAGFALDPASLLPVAEQALRFGGPSIQIQLVNSNTNVVSFNPEAPLLVSGAALANVGLFSKAVGEASLTIVQPQGYSAPAIRQQLAVKVGVPSLRIAPTYVGKDTQSVLRVEGIPGSISESLTVTSSDPSKLLLSANPTAPGSASVTIPNAQSSPPLFMQALDSQGTVTVRASIPGFRDAVAVMRLAPLTVVLSSQGGGSTPSSGKYLTSTQSPVTSIAVQLVVVDPNGAGLNPGIRVENLRPGADGWLVEVQSSNAAAGTILKSPVRLPAPGNPPVLPTVDFKPAATGETTVSVVQPPGFANIPSTSQLTFVVSAPPLIAGPTKQVIGKDSFVLAQAQLAENVNPPATNLTVTISSSDPSKLQVSREIDSTPAPAVTRTVIAGQRSAGPFYLHALSNEGSARVTISASGYADATIDVILTGTQFFFDTDPNVRAIAGSSPQTVRIAARPVTVFADGYSYSTPAYLRPGAPDIPIAIQSSDTSVVSVDSPVVFKAGASSAVLTYRPLRPGQATITLEPAAGYARDPKSSELNVSVAAPKIGLSGATVIGRDLETQLQIGAEDSFRQPATLTISSSDPSRLLVAAGATSPGQPSITVSTSGLPPIYLQALRDSGTATVTVSADGYQSASLPITFAPSAAVFVFTPSSITLTTAGGPQKVSVGVTTLDPITLSPRSSPELPRPGANLSVTVASSDTRVATVTSPSIAIAGENQSVEIRPAGPGSAIITLGLLPGGVNPSAGRQIVVSVPR